jgi:DNA-binding transcriptional ArsR family regulator
MPAGRRRPKSGQPVWQTSVASPFRTALSTFRLTGWPKGRSVPFNWWVERRRYCTVNQLAEPYQMTLQAVYKHLKVLEDAGVASRPPGPQPRSVRLEAEVFELMDKWIERYRRQAEERYRRLDAVLAQMNDQTANDREEQKGSAA